MATARAEYRNLDADVDRFFADGMGRLITEVGQDIVNETTELLTNGTGRAGVRVRSGRLRGSIEVRVVKQGRRYTITVGTRVDYARIVHDGRGPVRPKNAKALRWVTPGGAVVIRKSAGPAAARPFLLVGASRALAKRGITLRTGVSA